MQVLDIEASGLHHDSYPIEVGVYDINDPKNNFEFLIKPHESWTYWCPNAEAIHNIPRYAIEEHGISIEEACNILNDRIDDFALSDAPSYDGMWLSVLFETAGITPLFSLSKVSNVIDVYSLGEFDAYIHKIPRPHRALADAEIIGKAVEKFMHRPNLRY